MSIAWKDISIGDVVQIWSDDSSEGEWLWQMFEKLTRARVHALSRKPNYRVNHDSNSFRRENISS